MHVFTTESFDQTDGSDTDSMITDGLNSMDATEPLKFPSGNFWVLPTHRVPIFMALYMAL